MVIDYPAFYPETFDQRSRVEVDGSDNISRVWVRPESPL
jgi:hypothetical protein